MPFSQDQLDEIVDKVSTDDRRSPRLFQPLHHQVLTGQYKKEGYVVVDGLIPDEMYTPLCEAADRATEKGRTGQWDNVRVVGKQFPPWDASDAK